MKRSAMTHTKLKKLCVRLQIKNYVAVGILESLWHLTAREAYLGDIGKLSNEDICIGIDYDGDPDHLISVLVDCVWLDESAEHRLIVHDWHDHCEDAVKKAAHRAGKQFVSDSGGQDQTTADINRLPLPLPKPKPLDKTESVVKATGLEVPPEPTKPQHTRRNGSVPPSLPSYRLDENFVGFRTECDVYGMRCSEEEWQDCYQFEWTKSGIERQLKAREDIRHRTGVSDRSLVDVLPRNYLRKAMWERNVRDGSAPTTTSKQQIRDRTALDTLLGSRKASASVVHMTGRSFSHGSA